MDEQEIAMKVYQMLCANCPSAHKCHESCGSCEEHEDTLLETIEENRNAKEIKF